jgi:neutral amino acid transport system ATP-binding protein
LTADEILQVGDVSKAYGGVHAVEGASLDVRRGSITALIGPNGAGKSTLFNIISGFECPDAGEVVFEGERITRRAPYRIARQGMVRTFQLTKALAGLSVLENMLVGAANHPGERLLGVFRPRASRAAEREARERALELLDRFGLLDKQDDYAHILSGGQRKLLEMARALMPNPRLLLLDEPLAGINPTLGRALLEHMEHLRAKGMTFLFVEHDIEAVMRHSDRVIVMAAGKVIADGPPTGVRNDPTVIEAYLGNTTATTAVTP